ncbi:molybdopterin-dependent oxidoreductase [Streptomyces sp. P9(2023)]|uniref:molybdopterin-dependent oxidoreductase n=1 Tax=Streptomyces sp. P9(2023) TaxID=3064394 RepID=UPI0028F3ED3D|nr:molybdopterin-dependent oxidoreductase [Streptomyces sp. P9(2023)]MDT9690212.1 molybdopterin-dependent oxidoreductase [Streptomyces sp. P9(2023)]
MSASAVPQGPGATTWTPETVTTEPYNAQTPMAALAEPVTPAGALFVRDHFGVPPTEAAAWRLRVDGAVTKPLTLDYAQLIALGRPGRRELDVVLECAGNGRALMTPRPPGLPWELGAVGCARFAGVPFHLVAERAGVDPAAVEFVFTGADTGRVHGRPAAFERALPLAEALHPDTLLATHLNGEPLTPRHGAPVRLVVPGRYAVADVKWLVGARAVTVPFTGVFQTEEYVYIASNGTPDGPVGAIRVKSLITVPEQDEALRRGTETVVRGRAWSGGGRGVGRVEVRAEDEDGTGPGEGAPDAEWHDAGLEPPTGPYAWTGWSYPWTPRRPGRYRLLARATDTHGATQPDRAPWNAQGYGCNAVASVEVVVV